MDELVSPIFFKLVIVSVSHIFGTRICHYWNLEFFVLNFEPIHFLNCMLSISMALEVNYSMTFVSSCWGIFGKFYIFNFSERIEPLPDLRFIDLIQHVCEAPHIDFIVLLLFFFFLLSSWRESILPIVLRKREKLLFLELWSGSCSVFLCLWSLYH